MAGLASGNHLRVLLYHDVLPAERAGFAGQLAWLSRSWRFVAPGEFAGMVSGQSPVVGRNLLLTFDDGYASNRAVADEVLAPMGIRALFFVITDFVEITDRAEARQFIARNIRPGVGESEIDSGSYNMNWPDLRALIAAGHSIGAHTRSHARLSSLPRERLKDEIAASADILEQRLETPVEHFAYTFGDVESFSETALTAARTRFRFVHSGIRGDNAGAVSPAALRRDALSPRDSLSLVGALTEGAADFRYAGSRAVLDAWSVQA